MTWKWLECVVVRNKYTGGSSGGVAWVATPPLIFPKKCVIIRATVVTDLVVTSSNNACLCTWNSVVWIEPSFIARACGLVKTRRGRANVIQLVAPAPNAASSLTATSAGLRGVACVSAACWNKRPCNSFSAAMCPTKKRKIISCVFHFMSDKARFVRQKWQKNRRVCPTKNILCFGGVFLKNANYMRIHQAHACTLLLSSNM